MHKLLSTLKYLIFTLTLLCGVNAFAELPKVNKAVNSNLSHAIERAVERAVYDDEKTARSELKAVSTSITTNKSFPSGSFLDSSYTDRVLVPVGNNGLASYKVSKKGTASLKTVLNKK